MECSEAVTGIGFCFFFFTCLPDGLEMIVVEERLGCKRECRDSSEEDVPGREEVALDEEGTAAGIAS